jgi:hypothetical protein
LSGKDCSNRNISYRSPIPCRADGRFQFRRRHDDFAANERRLMQAASLGFVWICCLGFVTSPRKAGEVLTDGTISGLLRSVFCDRDPRTIVRTGPAPDAAARCDLDALSGAPQKDGFDTNGVS